MFMKRNQARDVRGFTLTEAAIVLGIVGLILAAIWAAAAAVYANMRVNDAQRGITMAAQQTRSMYAVSADTGVDGENITSPGLFPSSWVKPDGSGGYIYFNPWQKDATSSMARVDGYGSKFAIILDGVDADGCAALLGYFSQAAVAAEGGGVVGLIGAGLSDTLPDGAFASPMECSGADGGNTIAVGFDMKKM
jgi:type II secretory pathway pseudopilin PulG